MEADREIRVRVGDLLVSGDKTRATVAVGEQRVVVLIEDNARRNTRDVLSSAFLRCLDWAMDFQLENTPGYCP